MSTLNTADQALAGFVESTLRFGAQIGLIADADLATSLATILANIDTRAASVHQSQRGFAPMLKEAVTLGYNLLGSTPWTGGALSDVYAACPGTWAAGMA